MRLPCTVESIITAIAIEDIIIGIPRQIIPCCIGTLDILTITESGAL